MNSVSDRDRIVTWAFWVAAALAAVGGVVPLLFGGGINSRIAGVLVPFAVAAIAMAVNALFNQYGRLFTILLYFLAGVAMVYGVLSMLAIKLTLLVAGSCDPAPAVCPPGFQRPLTAAEDNSVNIVVAFAVLSILAGFYGLMVTYRRRPPLRTPIASATWPESDPSAPAKTAPAAAAPTEAPPVATAVPAPPAPPPAAPAPAPPAAARSRSRSKAKARTEAADEPKELPAHAEPKELPAPVEQKELPPPA